MDVQLQELVNKIKKDGVEAAEAKAAEIVAKAEEKAAAIQAAAKKEADDIVKKAESESARFEQAAVSAIRQAGRNLLISFRDGIGAELDALIRSETSSAYNAAVLKDLVPAAVRGWIANTGSDDVAVILSPSDAKTLESEFAAALKAEIAKGLEIKADQGVAGGFRIGTRDGASYYDFSAESVADLFSAYLNPRVAAVLREAAKEL